MYYEDIRLKYGETVSGLATEYAYKAADWKKIWLDTSKNLPCYLSYRVGQLLRFQAEHT
jgi:hypothetical protein